MRQWTQPAVYSPSLSTLEYVGGEASERRAEDTPSPSQDDTSLLRSEKGYQLPWRWAGPLKVFALIFAVIFVAWAAQHFIEVALYSDDFKIEFRRYDTHGKCNGTGPFSHQIGHDDYLHNTTCKTWISSQDIPFTTLFYSPVDDSGFMKKVQWLPNGFVGLVGLINGTRETGFWRWQGCTITVYAEKRCHGQSVTLDGVADLGKCITLKEGWQGRSVQVACPMQRIPVAEVILGFFGLIDDGS
ncbi:hypothetical protein LTR78_003164 [Recurvomyces mirabilis]|uniref:Uncharacterized protein n=1 Tax=Recurvomyces mirabilis TaxID=574656 RepID=A0AAE0WS15_9PEZI|nr:hypothetical protein LTR78_003164 [Recurvomyces mirabilis]KAK5157015.1 hypothetical protein LTS14_004532 [Recurvomyces mirabilis]